MTYLTSCTTLRGGPLAEAIKLAFVSSGQGELEDALLLRCCFCYSRHSLDDCSHTLKLGKVVLTLP